MRFAAHFVLAFSIVAPVAAAPNELTQSQINDGWISLFDGETLFGWQPTNGVDWRTAGGAIVATTGEEGWLMTTSQFADYELHLQFKSSASTNSGLFLQTPLKPPSPTKGCYEINIAPADNPFPTGSLVGRHKGEPVAESNQEWRSLDIALRGSQIVVKVDGRTVLKYVDPHPLGRGHIGLQFREGRIAFRNIRLKPLGTQPIFNGRDLTGWNTDRAEASRFEVTPASELRVLDGRGQLESNASYGDFILQLECLVDGDALNSGVFFRCIPGDFMMGYECQIQNGMIDGDPTKPADCGTGGFFRRQNARQIVARDREWFAMTLIADGPHMAAWVNGYQVSDWTDTRAPNENPRRGLRLEPGTIAIQGHDPTTDLRFRNLRVGELPEEE